MNTRPETLKVHDWDDHQSYRKDRGMPPWIKIHRTLLRDVKWVMMTDSERGQIVAIWLLAADHDGTIPADDNVVQKLCHMDAPPNLNKFIELGLLDAPVPSRRRQVVAKVTPDGQPDDRTETETELDTEEDTETDKKESWSGEPDDHVPPSDLAFDELWKCWQFHETPKGAKNKAVEQWKSKVWGSVDPEYVLTAAKAYCAQCRQTDTNTQHIFRWLRDKRWEDDYTPAIRNGDMAMMALYEKLRREDGYECEQSGNRAIGDRKSENGLLTGPQS